MTLFVGSRRYEGPYAPGLLRVLYRYGSHDISHRSWASLDHDRCRARFSRHGQLAVTFVAAGVTPDAPCGPRRAPGLAPCLPYVNRRLSRATPRSSGASAMGAHRDNRQATTVVGLALPKAQASCHRGARTGPPSCGRPVCAPRCDTSRQRPALCGQGAVGALPPLARERPHGVVPHVRCVGGGDWLQADGPRGHRSSSGPPGPSRRLVQDCCHSVLPRPISLGAVPTGLARAVQALLPQAAAMTAVVRHAPEGASDAPPGVATRPGKGCGP